MWSFADSPVLFCFILSVSFSYSLLLFFFFFPWDCKRFFWGGYDRILTSLLHSALRFGWRPALSAFSRAHSHLRHAQIPVSGARLHFAEPDGCGWKMNYSAGICLTDQASCDCTRVKEAVRKRSFWPCPNYLVVFPFVVKRQSQEGTFTSVHGPQGPWVLKLHINLEPRVSDVLSKQLKQPQGEVEKEVKMKWHNGGLCLHISGGAGNELCWMLRVITQVPPHSFSYIAGHSSDVRGSYHTVFRLSKANPDTGLGFF